MTVKWVEHTEVEDKQHYVLCWRSAREPLMKVAYENIRLKPQVKLLKNMTEHSLEEELHLIKFNLMEEGYRRGFSIAETDVMAGIFGAGFDNSEKEFFRGGGSCRWLYEHVDEEIDASSIGFPIGCILTSR